MTPDWLRVDLVIVEQVGVDAALVLALIEYRCNGATGWEAKHEQIAAALHLSVHRTKAALTALRDAELVTSTRADRFRPTLTWAPICAGQAVKLRDNFTRSGQTPHPVTQESTVTSYEEVQEVLVAVPTSPPVASKPGRRKPKTTYPADFRPTDSHRSKAQELGVDLTVEGPKFQHYHQAHDSRFSDWGAALHLWIRNAAKFAADRASADATIHHLPRTDPFAAAGAPLLPPRSRELYA